MTRKKGDPCNGCSCSASPCAPLLAAPGCSEDESATRVDLSRRVEAAAPAPPDAVTYAYLPQYSHAISYQRHHRLVEYLARATGMTFRQIFPATFDDHMNMVDRGEIDISFSNPFIYVRMADSLGARAFARMVEPRASRFSGAKSSPARTTRPSAPLTTAGANGGSPWTHIRRAAISSPWDTSWTTASARRISARSPSPPGPGGNQEKVVMAVYAGKYDIGSIREGSLDLLEGRIELDRLRVLAQTRPYPGWVYAARRGLDPAVTEAVRSALLSLDPTVPEHAAILNAAHMHSIIPAEDADYAPVRELAAKAGQISGSD